MSKDKNHIAPLTELSAEMMRQYLDNTLSNSERHSVEKYLLDNHFEAEAMQGYENQSMDIEQDLEVLSQRIEGLMERKDRKVIPLWRKPMPIAAAITVLVVGSLAIFQLFDIVEQKGQIVLNEPKEVQEEEEKESTEPSETIVENEDLLTIQEVETVPKPKERPERILREKAQVQLSPKEVAAPISKQQEEIYASEAGMDNLADMTPAEEEISEQPLAEMELDLADANQGMTVQSKSAASSARMKKSIVLADLRSSAAVDKIKGTVVDSEGEPIAGATVRVKKTGEVTITDFDGTFDIPIHAEDDVLSISFIGFTTQEIEVDQQDSVHAEMSLDMASLEEVVVIGYGESKKEDVANIAAQPMGGYRDFKKYLEDALIYPRWAKEQNVEGKVTIRFTVQSNGQLSDLEVVDGLGYGCDEEAIRLIEEGPDWTPARDNGSPKETEVKVKVKFGL